MRRQGCRIVFVASNAPNYAPGLLAHLTARNICGEAATATGLEEYALSKAYNVLFARNLAARLAMEERPARVLVFVSHPGFVATPIQRKATGLMAAVVRVLAGVFALSPARGAYSTLFAATAEGLTSGDGFGPSDYNRGLTCAWSPRNEIFDDARSAATLLDETLRVLAAKGRGIDMQPGTELLGMASALPLQPPRSAS
jgi:NAD(P)-dependent dehydrogenase (short-subunit alcohol dehydrogenase family)